jgi:hypothetical protein
MGVGGRQLDPCFKDIVKHGCCWPHSAQNSPKYSHLIVVLVGEQRHAFVMGVFFIPPYVLCGVVLHFFVRVVGDLVLCCQCTYSVVSS